MTSLCAPLKFRDATLADVPAIAALQNAAAAARTARFGETPARGLAPQERGRIVYKDNPLVYYELLLPG
jgi:uncharacterized glyoxalase superfamily metalloenzyme YdcJ